MKEDPSATLGMTRGTFAMLFVAASLMLNVSACGLKGKLKTPSQIESAEAKKERRKAKMNPKSPIRTEPKPVPDLPPMLPGATEGVLTNTDENPPAVKTDAEAVE